MNSGEAAKKKAQKLGVGSYEAHIFLCSGPSCCDTAVGERAWEHLKARTKEGSTKIFRTKTKCLRLCANGPIALVYPGGYWYHSADEAAIDRILDNHIRKGQPLTDLLIEENPL